MTTFDEPHQALEYAYKLADAYADKTNGYCAIRTCRYKFGNIDMITIEYTLTGQGLYPESFKTIELLIARLEELNNGQSL